ncbi:MAG: NADP-dependent malic enzyme [Marinifilaceae bacterium]
MAENELSPALQYHANKRPGKIEVVPTKPYSTQHDLSLAYSPGVAEPCLAIEKDPNLAYKYTAKSNLVAVISNGTAVLGLGDIGALAGKPVMEGKGLLFKVFADIDVFDIEVDTKDVDKFVETVKLISPTFGGVNLEDIKAPECFEIEDRLKKELNIPVMHDDQHGTAIISAAGMLNALAITGKKIEEIKVVVNGAGAAAVSCTRIYISLGVSPDNILMCDSKGVLTTSRTDLNAVKRTFARDTDKTTLREAIVGADLFLGLSTADVLDEEMLRSMANDPIVFALANPKPEISYERAMESRKDIIFATGRSDYPNQINNVLGFPYIFRGALDAGATCINEEMKLAAVHALAELTREPVPESVLLAYNLTHLNFGRDYIIPKPFDPRLISRIAPAVANAAMESGVARMAITDWDTYKYQLEKRIGHANKMMHIITNKAKSTKKRIAFADGELSKVILAARDLANDGILEPVLIGNEKVITDYINVNQITIKGYTIFDPEQEAETMKRLSEGYYQKMQRQGIGINEVKYAMESPATIAMMMVSLGCVDGCVAGLQDRYIKLVKRAQQLVGLKPCCNYASSMHIVSTQKGTYFLADTNVNIDPGVESLESSIVLTHDAVKQFDIEPVIALCSYSNFGEGDDESVQRVRAALDLVALRYPEICADGEMRADIALNTELRHKKFPFTRLGDKHVNTIIFPNLNAGNISLNLLKELGSKDVIGPILLGMDKPVHLLHTDATVRDIIHIATIAAYDAQNSDKVNMCRI